jgi:hypothetical protein
LRREGRFSYLDPAGEPIRDAAIIDRIRSMAWICQVAVIALLERAARKVRETARARR